MEVLELSDLREQKLKLIEEIRNEGRNPYPYRFEKDMKVEEIKEKYGNISDGELLENDIFKFAGRVMSIRKHGKSAFIVLKDDTGRIQAYIKKDKVPDGKFDEFKKYMDIGDWVGLEGFPFKTHTGELTILILNFEILSKALRPLPEKWHGLKDREIKYRQRYVDMIANDESLKTFVTRFKAIRYIREFLHSKGFIEVETPVLHPILGGANARPFVTHLNVYDVDMYLRIAPELYLKRLVVGGMEKVFEIGKNFRNEGVSYKHNPEFTMMELYQAYADYTDMMKLTEDVLSYVVEKIHGTTKINYQGVEIDFKPPFKRVKMRDFIKEHLGVDILEDPDEKLVEVLKENGVEVSVEDKGHYIDELWSLVEHHIVQPTFVLEHPVEISPLAKRHREDPRVTERFELIIYGRELANAFSELNDPVDQLQRFKKQVELKDMGDEEAQMMDLDFVRALEYGLPPTGGLGIGIDRFVMFLTNAETIRDVIAYPIVKPMNFEDEENLFESDE
ncbi:lysine--tRNA ligase [Marinitoga sp. 38H-ov]|uniref:lysine--tRNA ligase n=1 Tax=Marinitoga sp. 38H-ov TaxID=1755814 RepID=UPI0013EA8966|nr:lysine--tRNA ligase [Marinitoga sp. 38H-ov]